MITFAEKLKQHNKYCDELLAEARELISQSKKNEQFGQRADDLLDKVDSAKRAFERDNYQDFKTLEVYLKGEETAVFCTIAEEVKNQFKLDINSIHGLKHWERVMKIGFRIGVSTNADLRVVNLFSILHDSCRENDDYDPDHGLRAADYTGMLFQKSLLPINRKQLDQLKYACTHHNDRHAKSSDITIQTCWDADRLDLFRVGDIPDPAFLYTDIAKDRSMTDYVLKLLKNNYGKN